MSRINLLSKTRKGKQEIRIIISLLFLLFSHSLWADMGSILTSNARVQEDSQKAIILHNSNNEEILILGTDLKADQKTSIVRFIPFPSEPTVKLAPAKAFKSAAELIKSHELMKLFYTKGGGPLTQGVEIHFSKKMGVHDITIIKINDAAQFRNWVNNFFKSKRIPQKKNYPNIEKIVKEYLSRGIKWFVFDYVKVDMYTHMIQPVEYGFKSKDLYYPLITSNTFGGHGGIDLIMITPCTPCSLSPDCFDMNLFGMQATTSSQLRYDELTNILPDAKQFFGGKKIFIQMAQYWGVYHFYNDIFYDLSKGKPEALWVEEVSPGVVYNGFNRFNITLPEKLKTFQPKNKSFTVKIPEEGWENTVSNNPQTGETYKLTLSHSDNTTIEIEKKSGQSVTVKQFTDNLLNPPNKPPYEDFSLVDSVNYGTRKALKFEIKTRRSFQNGKKEVPTDVILKYVIFPQPKGFYVIRLEAPLIIAKKYSELLYEIASSFTPSK